MAAREDAPPPTSMIAASRGTPVAAIMRSDVSGVSSYQLTAAASLVATLSQCSCSVFTRRAREESQPGHTACA